MNSQQVKELILQALEHERGGVKIYKAALTCAIRVDLKAEWTRYLQQTESHVETLTGICEVVGLDPFCMTPGTQVAKFTGLALVQAIEQARSTTGDAAAQIVAAECVVLAETKDHLDWELLGQVAKQLTGQGRKLLAEAAERIEAQEDEHLYHSQGWCRELWMQALGLDAVLPPPEDRRDVTSAAEAQRAKEESRRTSH
jgi:rubrerythrin